VRQNYNTVGTDNVIRDVGFLPDGLYSDTVPQGTFSPSVTSCRQELHPLGIFFSHLIKYLCSCIVIPVSCLH
jgi:hypothetical protein